MTTEPRKPGWYWVKLPEGERWFPAQTLPTYGWKCEGSVFTSEEFAVIGPRAPTPDEDTDSIEYLIEKQGVKPLASIEQLRGLWPEEPTDAAGENPGTLGTLDEG